MADLSPKFERIFALIDEAGGTKLPNVNKLNSKDKQSVIFNIWGGLFGLFYYLYYRMWKKGLVLTLISIVVSIAVQLILAIFISESTMDSIGSFVSLGISVAIFGTRANIDLYKKYRQGDDGWI